VDKRSQLPALYPYLDSVYSASYLQISLNAEPPALEKTPFPFLAITDSSPLLRVIEAQWVTDAGSVVRRVFLLVQKDRYALKRDELWPVTNLDIDDSWQKAFSFHSSGQGDLAPMILSNQVDERGGLKPFQPLLYCKRRKAFFPPPCPQCGLPLERCDDEGALTLSGLQPYATSLKRYLSCPACLSEGKLDFYVYELESDDPPQLKDRWALTKEFGALIERRNPITQFPCMECQDRQACYGSDQKALSRIVPFSFYPFYLLIQEAATLNAMDFLALLSGASYEELEGQLKVKGESGRIRCLKTLQKREMEKGPFLFKTDKRFFLEILYLKLSFLGQVFQAISSREGMDRHPDLRLSTDQIWIDLKDPEDFLPFFWNFKVKVMDVIRDPLDSQLIPPLPASSVLFFSGLIWFFTLLVNRRQNISHVYRSFGEEMKWASPDENFSFGNLSKRGTNEAFLPRNIFWDPEGKVITREWRSLWERSLDLGWRLLNTSFQPSPQWSKEVFSRELEELREEVKELLFRRGPEARKQTEAVQRGRNEEDRAIQAILMEIIHQPPAGYRSEKEEFPETVILSSHGPTPAEEKWVEDEEMRETVFLSTPRPGKGKNVEVDFPETMILSPSQSWKGFAPASEAEKLKEGRITTRELSQEDFFAETVILKPRKAPEKKNGKNE
jgi:hypothetical protein